VITDTWTVMWKEWKELLTLQTGLRGGKYGFLLLILILGVLMPWQQGRLWVEVPAFLLVWAWFPLFLVAAVTADAFAGERERHTLETLLASRLSDWVILLGKVFAMISYGWSIALLCWFVGLVTVNVTSGSGELILYPMITVLGFFALTLLSAGLGAGAGILVSLRATTVRQAQQSLTLSIMALLLVPAFGFQMLPGNWTEWLYATVSAWDLARVILISVVILALIDTALIAAAMARFKRSRLIAD
jgi:ABC-2 type transport system permease protein